MHISENEAALKMVHALRLDRMSFTEIGAVVRKKFPEFSDYTDKRIRENYNQWADSRELSRPIVKTPNRARNAFHDKQNPFNYLPIACQLHLIDIKRAGHSPTRTELRFKAKRSIESVCHKRDVEASYVA